MKGGGGGEKKMTVEEYVEFFVSKNSTASTIPYLNQILHIHGFRKLHKTHKKIVGEAVDSLELLDLSRSTLKQTGISSSSSASVSLEEVITDIEALKWQECCLTSLHIINSDQVTQSVTKPIKRKRTKTMRMKKKSLRFGHDDDDDDDDDDVETTTIQDLLGKNKKKKKKKKKKRKSIRSVNGLVFD